VYKAGQLYGSVSTHPPPPISLKLSTVASVINSTGFSARDKWLYRKASMQKFYFYLFLVKNNDSLCQVSSLDLEKIITEFHWQIQRYISLEFPSNIVKFPLSLSELVPTELPWYIYS
jgi:hypothetical protein